MTRPSVKAFRLRPAAGLIAAHPGASRDAPRLAGDILVCTAFSADFAMAGAGILAPRFAAQNIRKQFCFSDRLTE
jgi:hypothetical protein